MITEDIQGGSRNLGKGVLEPAALGRGACVKKDAFPIVFKRGGE